MLTRRDAEPRAGTPIGSLPPQLDLLMYQGDDFYLNIHVDDSQVAIDLTDYEVDAVVRAKLGDTTVLATFVGTVLDPTTVRLHLPSAQSAKLVDKAVWDVQVTDLSGQVTTLAYGSITLVREVTS